MELLTEGHHLIIYTRARASRAYLRVDVVGHIQHRSPFGEFQQVALGGEDVYLVVVEVHAELIHRLHTAGTFQHLPDAVQPFVHAATLGLHAFVSPVGGDASLGHLVHPLCAYLHLHPFLLRSQHGDVQTLVAIRFWHAEPVAHTLGVRGVHIGDDGERLPALLFLLLRLTVYDDAYGKEVVHALELAFLLLHLLPDGVYALRAPLHVELQSGLFQLLFYRPNKLADIGIAHLLRGVQLLLDVIVGIGLQVFQRQVFQFALHLVETQFVSQWRIQIGRLFAHSPFGLLVVGIANLSHQVHAVGNHDQDHTHILGKREQQVAEVLAFDDGILLIQILYALQAVEYSSYG